jgi:hypothetical protein
MGHADRGTLDILWPGGVRNRFYGLRASEHLVLPEIPCGYDADWNSRHDYNRCVTTAIGELAHAGKIRQDLIGRLTQSAMRAFNEAHHTQPES